MITRLQLVVLCAALTSVACDGGGQRADGIVGRWHAVDTTMSMSVTFSADSAFAMNTANFDGEGRYTLAEDGTLTLLPEGTLAAVVPAGYTGSMTGDTMELCMPGSSTCSRFLRAPRE